MKYLFVLFGLLILASAAFAIPQQCFDQEATCLRTCCAAAGGTVQDVNSANVECENPTDAASAQFFSCANSQCRPTVISCAVPTGTCTQQFQSCVAACSDNSCKDSCYIGAGNCINQYESQPNTETGSPTGYTPDNSSSDSCCGSAFVLLGVLSVAVFSRQ
ncbi:MAG: hypothetical protein V1492_06275 [Candidatus Micrarchaeota archaeon]